MKSSTAMPRTARRWAGCSICSRRESACPRVPRWSSIAAWPIAENLTEIRQRKLHYVVAARQPERDQWLDQFEEPEGFELVPRQPSPLNPCQKKSIVRVKSIEHDGELIVLCTSEERVEKDRAIRQKQEGRFLADLERLQRRIENGRLNANDRHWGGDRPPERALSPGGPLSHDQLRPNHSKAES